MSGHASGLLERVEAFAEAARAVAEAVRWEFTDESRARPKTVL